jgi:hypothetical protein
MFSGENILRGDLVVDIENGGYSSILVVACGRLSICLIQSTLRDIIGRARCQEDKAKE